MCKYCEIDKESKCACWYLISTNIQSIDDVPLFGKPIRKLVKLMEE